VHLLDFCLSIGRLLILVDDCYVYVELCGKLDMNVVGTIIVFDFHNG